MIIIGGREVPENAEQCRASQWCANSTFGFVVIPLNPWNGPF